MPYILHYFEAFTSRREASRRERFFKSIEGYTWLRVTHIIE
jgi:putative endonuclease